MKQGMKFEEHHKGYVRYGGKQLPGSLMGRHHWFMRSQEVWTWCPICEETYFIAPLVYRYCDWRDGKFLPKREVR